MSSEVCDRVSITFGTHSRFRSFPQKNPWAVGMKIRPRTRSNVSLIWSQVLGSESMVMAISSNHETKFHSKPVGTQ